MKRLMMMKKIILTTLLALCLTACGNRMKPVAEEIIDTVSSAHYEDGENMKPVKPDENDPVIGMFKCEETNDRYYFDEDGRGAFENGGILTDFVWVHQGDIVTVEYVSLGKTNLYYDKKKKMILEDSHIFDRILRFKKIY